MPRSARRCGTGLRPLVASKVEACGCVTTGPVAKIRREVGQALHARRDIDGRAEIILAVVEDDRQARPFMDADFEQQILVAVTPR